MLIVTLFLLSPPQSSEKPNGYLRIYVVDGMTNQPVKNANICLIETEKYYKTDDFGYTEKIICPITYRANSNYKRNWGEVTVICYKEGYNDCVIFNVEVKKDIVRLGPTIYLFPQINENKRKILTETPNEDWITGLIDRYRK